MPGAHPGLVHTGPGPVPMPPQPVAGPHGQYHPQMYPVPGQPMQINHPHYQTAGVGPNQQTTSILINGSNGQPMPMPPFYIMNHQAGNGGPAQQQGGSNGNSGPASGSASSSNLKVKKAVVSVNDSHAGNNSGNGNQRNFQNNSSRFCLIILTT